MRNQIAPYRTNGISTTRDRGNAEYGLMQRTYEMAELDAFRDKLRAALAKQAMDNTAILAMAEEHFIRIAPSGKAEYRLIVQTYARKALAEILGGEW